MSPADQKIALDAVASHLAATAYRHAFVGLWALASVHGVLNHWEQVRVVALFEVDLLRIRAEFDNPTADWPAMLSTTPLAVFVALDRLLGQQSVRSLEGNPSSFVFDFLGAEYFLVPTVLASRHSARFASQAGNICAWAKNHFVIPKQLPGGIEVVLHLIAGSAQVRWQAVADQVAPQLKVWVGHFDDGADVVWGAPLPSGNVRCSAVTPAETRKTSILASLEAALAAGAHVVIFPEFTIDVAQRQVVRKWLQKHKNHDNAPLLVVAGSFHEDCDGQFFNSAPVMDGAGNSLFSHRKLQIFGRPDIAEGIEVGNQLHVLMTPLGCFSVVICKDFLDGGATLSTLFLSAPVDWVLVPSYGDQSTERAHLRRAQERADQGTAINVVVAQTKNTYLIRHAGKEIPNMLGFGVAAGQKEAQFVGLNGGLLTLPADLPSAA